MRSHILATWVASVTTIAGGCGGAPDEEPARRAIEERLSRTEFTETFENFFEFDPLRAGRESAFLIHLTQLAEGAPVAGAKVDVRILSNGRLVAESRARPAQVNGIYVAEVVLPDPVEPGPCEVEFRIVSETVDETMRLSGFTVE